VRHNTVHRMNHFSKEGFETGIFIGAQIAGEISRRVNFPLWLVTSSRLTQPRITAVFMSVRNPQGEKYIFAYICTSFVGMSRCKALQCQTETNNFFFFGFPTDMKTAVFVTSRFIQGLHVGAFENGGNSGTPGGASIRGDKDMLMGLNASRR
jgi:hypothetical protein